MIAKNILSLVAVCALTMVPGTAAAYLDPGTGSIMLQGLIALVGGTITTVALYWRSVKAFVRRVLGRETDSDPQPPM